MRVYIPSFVEWYDGKGGARWKLDYYDSFGGHFSRRAKAAAKEIDPSYTPQDFLYCGRGRLTEEDWVLKVRLTKDGGWLNPHWVYIERVVLVEKSDRAYNADYPFQAIQVRERRHCPPPPFLITPAFKKALKDASTDMGREASAAQVESKPPTDGFLRRLRMLM